jgi:hypothetical protein
MGYKWEKGHFIVPNQALYQAKLHPELVYNERLKSLPVNLKKPACILPLDTAKWPYEPDHEAAGRF